jgi:hypothetical protein
MKKKVRLRLSLNIETVKMIMIMIMMIRKKNEKTGIFLLDETSLLCSQKQYVLPSLPID